MTLAEGNAYCKQVLKFLGFTHARPMGNDPDVRVKARRSFQPDAAELVGGKATMEERI